MTDERIAYGATCVWWGSIHDVGRKQTSRGFSLPCCPMCGGMLFEVESEAQWWDQVKLYEQDGHPGYEAFMVWLRGRCLPTLADAQHLYAVEKNYQ